MVRTNSRNSLNELVFGHPSDEASEKNRLIIQTMKDEDIDENEMMRVIVIVPIENGVNSGKCVPLSRALAISSSYRHFLLAPSS